MNDFPTSRYTQLSQTDLAEYISSIIEVKIQASDLNNTSKLDEITCVLLSKVTGINIQRDNRILYFRLLAFVFKSIGFSQPINLQDIFDERDMKKWMRMLSYFIDITGKWKNIQSAATEYVGKSIVATEKLNSEYKHVEELEERLRHEKTKFAADEEKIERLSIQCSEATKDYEEAQNSLKFVKREHALLLEKEAAEISKVTASEMDIKILTDRLAHLESRVIEDPDQLPVKIKEMEIKANDFELKIHSVYEQLGEANHSITRRSALTTTIDREIVATADDCFSCLDKITSLQSEIAGLKLENNVDENGVQALLKEISGLMEKLDLIVSSVFRQKIIFENQKKLDENVRSEKEEKLKNLSSRIAEISEKIRIKEIYLDDIKALYEKEYSSTEREEQLNLWARIEANLKHLLQKYAEAYQ